MAMIDHHHDHTTDGGLTASMMVVLLAVIAALILLGVVFAWNPWANDGTTAPGQGGEDEPVMEEQVAPNIVR
jgi:hypothetical protein